MSKYNYTGDVINTFNSLNTGMPMVGFYLQEEEEKLSNNSLAYLLQSAPIFYYDPCLSDWDRLPGTGDLKSGDR